MKPETVDLLCAPGTHELLRLETGREPGEERQEYLVGVHSGQCFPVREGIPLLVDESKITGFNLQFRSFYNRVAGGYDGAIRLFTALASGGEAKFRSEFLRRVEISEGGRLLEVSIGTGANIRYLPASAECFGLDLSWGMLKKCRKNLQSWNRRVELILGNAEELPFVGEAFDAVLHMGGINAFNDRAAAIQEMIRVARPGTKIVIVDETARLLERFRWSPTTRKWLDEHGERFSAPVELVPADMQELKAIEIASGNMYCLTFRKP